MREVNVITEDLRKAEDLICNLREELRHAERTDMALQGMKLVEKLSETNELHSINVDRIVSVLEFIGGVDFDESLVLTHVGEDLWDVKIRHQA